jgi:hypothetical protein
MYSAIKDIKIEAYVGQMNKRKAYLSINLAVRYLNRLFAGYFLQAGSMTLPA